MGCNNSILDKKVNHVNVSKCVYDTLISCDIVNDVINLILEYYMGMKSVWILFNHEIEHTILHDDKFTQINQTKNNFTKVIPYKHNDTKFLLLTQSDIRNQNMYTIYYNKTTKKQHIPTIYFLSRMPDISNNHLWSVDGTGHYSQICKESSDSFFCNNTLSEKNDSEFQYTECRNLIMMVLNKNIDDDHYNIITTTNYKSIKIGYEIEYELSLYTDDVKSDHMLPLIDHKLPMVNKLFSHEINYLPYLLSGHHSKNRDTVYLVPRNDTKKIIIYDIHLHEGKNTMLMNEVDFEDNIVSIDSSPKQHGELIVLTKHKVLCVMYDEISKYVQRDCEHLSELLKNDDVIVRSRDISWRYEDMHNKTNEVITLSIIKKRRTKILDKTKYFLDVIEMKQILQDS